VIFVTQVFKKNHSTGLGDRSREGKGWNKPDLWPPQWGVGSLEPNLGKQLSCSFMLIIIIQFVSPLPLSLKFSCSQPFELAFKVIRIDWATHSKKNYLLHSTIHYYFLNITPGEVRVQNLEFSGFAYSPPLGVFHIWQIKFSSVNYLCEGLSCS
jgi:hypothetical protein